MFVILEMIPDNPPIAVENTQNNATCAKLMVVEAIFIGYTLE